MNINLNKLKVKSFIIPTVYYIYLNFIQKRKEAICFNELDENIQKNILKKKTDIYIWGKGFANDTSIYTNFHPHRMKRLINDTNPKALPNEIIDITFGEHFAACIDKDYNLFVWKEPKLNSEKSKEIDNHQRSNIERIANGLKVINFSFTKDKLFFLDMKGNVYMYNITIKQPQNEEFFASSLPEPEVNIQKNNLIQIKELKDIKLISSGKDHFVAFDSFGQLGQSNYSEQREMQMKMYNNFIERRERMPKKIEIPEKIKKIVCGENHTLVLSEGGNVYGFGYNRFLQLSNDGLYRQGIIGLSSPTLIQTDKFKSMKVVDIAACKNTSYFICHNQVNGTYHFFSCGEGLRGQLGQNLIKHLSDIEEMPDISGLVNASNMKPFEPLKLKCGLNHCLLLFKNPRMLYLWGNNEFGELGTKDRVFYESPVPMLEEYIIPFNIVNFGVGFTNSAFICEKVDKLKKKEILNQDKKFYEEEMNEKRKKRRNKENSDNNDPKIEKKSDDNSYFKNPLDQLIKTIKKYI
jgi:alpha-tubulin suppressor-like RCC1 family protein